MATCGTMIEGNVVSFMCDLEAGHQGPHRAVENARSVRERQKWEADQAHQNSGLGQFQGKAETTAERYTENPTEVPKTQAQKVEEQVVRCTAMSYLNGQCILVSPHPGEHQFASVSVEDVIESVRAGEAPPMEPVVYTEAQDGSAAFRPASIAEAKVAGIEPQKYPAPVTVPSESVVDGPAVPTKQRPGDQPLPQITGEESVQARIIRKTKMLVEAGKVSEAEFALIEKQMLDSIRVGTERYGTALQTFNGRDTLQDAAEEARDLYVYLNALMQAREAQAETLVEVATEVMAAKWREMAQQGVTGTPEEHCRSLASVAIEAILKATGPLGET